MALVANGAHPRFSVDELNNDIAAVMERIADYGPWELAHFLAMVAGLLWLATFYALSRSVGPGGETWGRLGWASAIVGITLAVVALIVDGFSAGAMAEHIAGSSGAEEAALLASAAGVEAIANPAFGTWTLVLLGMTPIIYGLAINAGDGYPAYLGWLALLTGGLGLTAGVIQLFAGFTVVGFLFLFTAASVLATVWILIIGWHQWRKARAAHEEPVGVTR